MKKMVVLSMLVCFAMISACQKQDAAAEAQLAQRKSDLDAREKALDEREKALGDWEKAITRFRPAPADLQPRKPAVDPEQAKAEREKRIQQLPPELQALIRDRSLLDPRTEKPPATDDRVAELQRRLEDARKKKTDVTGPSNPDGANNQSTSPAPSPTPE
jgi:predicted  nucleic acid-binding Zn-ribbon protein